MVELVEVVKCVNCPNLFDYVLTLLGISVVSTPSRWVPCAGRHNGACQPRYHVL
jgi:hypothetical protein